MRHLHDLPEASREGGEAMAVTVTVDLGPPYRCEVQALGCSREAAPGARYCQVGHWNALTPMCLVRDCPRGNGGGWLCDAHGREHYNHDGVGPFTWVASRVASPLPVPSSVTTHGLPAGVYLGTVEAALLGVGVPSERAPDEDDEEEDEAPQPRCLWSGCLVYRKPGSPFCEEHRDEGMRALSAEVQSVPASAPSLPTWADVASAPVSVVPGSYDAITVFQSDGLAYTLPVRSVSSGTVTFGISLPAQQPPYRACVAGLCGRPRVTGHALCSSHLSELEGGAR
jgi:hypothetical protein